MKLLEQIERINLIHRLTEQRHTGKPEALAKRLNISVSRLYAIIDELRQLGVPILYCRSTCTYYYAYKYEINIAVNFKPLNQTELKIINGGCTLNIHHKTNKNIFFTTFFVE
jgi:predicted DNA-binding transcriptional regulator YafY